MLCYATDVIDRISNNVACVGVSQRLECQQEQIITIADGRKDETITSTVRILACSAPAEFWWGSLDEAHAVS